VAKARGPGYDETAANRVSHLVERSADYVEYADVDGHSLGSLLVVRNDPTEDDFIMEFAPHVHARDYRSGMSYSARDINEQKREVRAYGVRLDAGGGTMTLVPVNYGDFVNVQPPMAGVPADAYMLYAGTDLADQLMDAQSEEHRAALRAEREKSDASRGGVGRGVPAAERGGGTTPSATSGRGGADGVAASGPAASVETDKLAGNTRLLALVASCYNGGPMRDAQKGTWMAFKSTMAFVLANAEREQEHLKYGSNVLDVAATKRIIEHAHEAIIENSGVETPALAALGARFWPHIKADHMVVSDSSLTAFILGKLAWRPEPGMYALEEFSSKKGAVVRLIVRGEGTVAEQVDEMVHLLTLLARMLGCFVNVQMYALLMPYVDRLAQRDTVTLTARPGLQAHQLPMVAVLLLTIQGMRQHIRKSVASREHDGLGFETPSQCMRQFKALVVDPLESLDLAKAEVVKHLLFQHMGDVTVREKKGPAKPQDLTADAKTVVCGPFLSGWLVQGSRYPKCTRSCDKKAHISSAAKFFAAFPTLGDLEAWMASAPQTWGDRRKEEHVAAYKKKRESHSG
jgi:hypothetical protein